MDKTNIRMYLTYWFRENPREEEVVKALSETGIGEYRYVRTKRGGTGVKFFPVRRETWDFVEVSDLFLDRCEPFIEGLNRFSGRFKGFYRLEIVPEMYDEEKVALVFDRRFLNFLKALNELDDIDVDQYVFW